MSVSNKNGHGVTNQAGTHNQQVLPAKPNFVPTQGPANRKAPGSQKKNYPPAK